MEYNVKTVKFQQSLFSWCSKFVKCTARPSVAISAQEELITYTFYSLHFYIEMNTNFKLLFKHPLEMFFKKGKGSSKTSAIGHAFVRLQQISPLLPPQSQASSRHLRPAGSALHIKQVSAVSLWVSMLLLCPLEF